MKHRGSVGGPPPTEEVEPTASDLVLGLDVGGTASRALVCDLAGNRLGRGTSGGGNPAAHPAHRAAAAIGVALRGALGDVDPARVRHGVVGLAGRRTLGRPEVWSALRRTWHEAGLSCPMTVVPDSVVAFAAGTSADTGSVLVAGTGATAVRVERRRAVRRADGLGWLLGDLGSGFWMGREAVRATLEALEGRASAPVLAPMVLRELLGEPADRPAGDGVAEHAEALVGAVYDDRPVALARLAPLVTAAAERRDAAALGIVEDAAGHLLASLAGVRRPGERTPVVLGGSCLTTPNPLSARTVREIGLRWPGAEVRRARDGAAGAACLAASEAGVGDAVLAELHRALLDG